MERLPNELIDSIVANLSKADIVNLRLTNRQLSEGSAHLLYPRLWLSSHPLDLEVARRVLHNSSICDGVQELIWDDTTYCDSLISRKRYMETVDQVTSYCYVCPEDYTLEEKESGYQILRKNATLHRYIRRERIDERLLCKALPLLKNLKHVVLTRRHHVNPVPADENERTNSPSARQLRNQISGKTEQFYPTVNWYGAYSPSTRKSVSELRTINYHYDPLYDTEDPEEDDVHVRRPFRGLIILLRALAGAGVRLESFVIRPQYESGLGKDNSSVGILHWFFRYPSSELECMISIFRTLRKLHLVLGSDLDDLEGRSARETVKAGHLTHVLQVATQLEEVYLELPEMPAMEALGTESYFPELKSLELVNGDMDPVLLFRFLKKHRRPLKRFHLSYCVSEQTSWAELFRCMRADGVFIDSISGHSLSNLTEPGCFHVTSQQEIDSYIRHGEGLPLRWSSHRSGTPPPRF